MKAGPLSCPQCGAQVWGVPPEFDYFFGKDPKSLAGVWASVDAECSNKHACTVKLYPEKPAEVELKKAVGETEKFPTPQTTIGGAG